MERDLLTGFLIYSDGIAAISSVGAVEFGLEQFGRLLIHLKQRPFLSNRSVHDFLRSVQQFRAHFRARPIRHRCRSKVECLPSDMNNSQNAQSSRRAIFLDRDGTLNEEVGYICDPAQFRLLDVAAEAVRLVNETGWLVIVITNQAGIARGLFTEEFLAGLHQRMTEELTEAGARVDAIYYCPHHPEIGEPPYRQVCDCRKPLPGLLTRAAAEFNLDLSECLVIGDRYGDVAAAQAAGSRGVLVLTGHGREEFERERDNDHIVADHIAANVLEAVQWVINES